jgi:MoxR-like ATPase
MTLSERLSYLIKAASTELYGKENIIKASILSVLAGQNIFLYGPPGTAKSMIARRISKIFKDTNIFEHLMHRFCTPEELFGPVSLSELKKDNYKRLTKGYLAEAGFAFLDEIWKSSPAVLNTLLTLINEHKYHNGSEVIDVPLKSLISASNEIPQRDEGLDALYDRFLVRLEVNPIDKDAVFMSMLKNSDKLSDQDLIVSEDLKISSDDYIRWLHEVDKVQLSDECVKAITSIRNVVREYLYSNDKVWDKNKHNGIEKLSYISDRRFLQAVKLVKAAAYFNNRKVTSPVDLLVLKNSLWSTLEDKRSFEILVEDTVKTTLKDMSKSNMNDETYALIEQKIRELKSNNIQIIISSGEVKIKQNKDNLEYKKTDFQFMNVTN